MSKQVFGKKEGREEAAQIEIKLLKSNTLHMMHWIHTNPMGLERQSYSFSRESEVTGAV